MNIIDQIEQKRLEFLRSGRNPNTVVMSTHVYREILNDFNYYYQIGTAITYFMDMRIIQSLELKEDEFIICESI